MTKTTVTRRVVLGGVLYTVTAACLPACTDPETGSTQVVTDGDFFDAHQLSLLSEVAEIMIPRTETPGATDAQVATVIDQLMLTWAGTSTKATLPSLLASFDERAQGAHGMAFLELSLEQRTGIVESLDQRSFSDSPPDDAEAYKKLKFLVFRVYSTSEEAGTNYVPVPGLYDGNLTLDEYNALMEERAYG